METKDSKEDLKTETKAEEHQDNSKKQDLSQFLYNDLLSLDDVDITKTVMTLPDQTLKHLAFYTTIENAEHPKEAFNDLLKSIIKRSEDINEKAQQPLLSEITRIEISFTEINGSKNELEKEYEEYRNSIIELKKGQSVLAKSLEGSKQKIFNFFKELTEYKKKFLDDRITEIQKLLNRIVEGQKEHTDNHTHHLNVEKGKKLVDAMLERYEDYVNKIKDQFDKTNRLLFHFHKYGLTPIVLSILNYGGMVSALVAGWFFLNFTTTNISSNGSSWVNSSIINCVIESFLSFVRTHDRRLVIVYLLIFILSMTLLSYAFDFIKRWYISKLEKRETSDTGKAQTNLNGQNSFGFSSKELKGLPFRMELSNERWVFFLVDLLPVILMVGIILIIMSYGNCQGNNKSSLIGSVGSETVGFFMAVGMSAAYYLLISVNSKFIYRDRGEVNATDSDYLHGNKTLKRGIIGFIIALVLINISVVALYLMMDIKSQSPGMPMTKALAFVGFFTFANVAGICIGFSMFGRGLIGNASYLEFKLDMAQIRLKYFYHSTLSYFFTYDFGRVYKELYEEMLVLLLKRVNPAKFIKDEQQYSDILIPFKKKVGRNWRSFFLQIKSLFNKDEQQKADQSKWEMNDKDLAFYPELASELHSYNQERLDIEGKIKDNEAKISGFDLKTSLWFIEKEKRLDKTRTQIENLASRIKDLKIRIVLQDKMIQEKLDKDLVELKDGFNLGMWYRENKIGP